MTADTALHLSTAVSVAAVMSITVLITCWSDHDDS